METVKLSEEQFRISLWILLHNYHAVNRKIFACIIEEVFEVNNHIQSLITLIDPTDSNVTAVSNLRRCTESELQEALSKPLPKIVGFVVKQKFLTKKLQENISAVSIIDFSDNSYTCKFGDSNLDDFVIRYNDEGLHFQPLTQRNALETSDRWLQHVLKPKLVKWAMNAPTKPTTKSLQLIDVEAYNDLYKQLKCKHAEKLKGIWLEANESTDPLKFIYEDLAIAAYLICLWQSENAKEPKAFADLGCGNGLLVHILTEEGYAGYGYDIRKRKLWSLYSKTVQTRLIEAAIVPFEFSLPIEVDWLIGNHSDELSPWLPVLAALESYEMSYFLLPCCAFEFSGAKFQRRNAKMSTYQDFYCHARVLSQRSGFQTLEDRLKIPSTKRLALVGCQRIYDQSQYTTKRKELRSFVEEEMLRFPHTSIVDPQIKLREKHESVRNCTKLDTNILAVLVNKIFKLLLTTPATTDALNDHHWHTGGSLSMKQIVHSLTSQELQHIKSECGGIKTLLRNKHEVFEFLGNDLIGLRKPQKCKEQRPETVKRRACYFNENHPDGCPLSDVDCNFLHDKLR